MNTSWNQISSLDYSPTKHYDYFDEFPTIELTAEGNNWRIFWAQEVKPDLYEIFTVTYNSGSDEWSLVIQITDTKTITDDFELDCRSIPGVLFPFTLLGLVIAVQFLELIERIRAILI